MPEFLVETEGGIITGIVVVRGAPCGATWDAAARLVGERVEKAGERIGLETQFFCSADPAHWDILHGKSPVHFAGSMHQKALDRALKKEKNIK